MKKVFASMSGLAGCLAMAMAAIPAAQGAVLVTDRKLATSCETPVMVVWLHGSEGWDGSWGKGFHDTVDEDWLEECAKSVFPEIHYLKGRPMHNAIWSMRSDHEALQKQVAEARAAHGRLPTLYIGWSRGGLMALYAAKRDELAEGVVSVAGTLSAEHKLRGGKHTVKRWRKRERMILEDGGEAPRLGTWIYGEKDPYTDIGWAREMHRIYGGDGHRFVTVKGGGHGLSWTKTVRPEFSKVLKGMQSRGE